MILATLLPLRGATLGLHLIMACLFFSVQLDMVMVTVTASELERKADYEEKNDAANSYVVASVTLLVLEIAMVCAWHIHNCVFLTQPSAPIRFCAIREISDTSTFSSIRILQFLSGVTMAWPRITLSSVLLHSFGWFLSAWAMLDCWPYTVLSRMFWIFIFIPFTMEACCTLPPLARRFCANPLNTSAESWSDTGAACARAGATMHSCGCVFDQQVSIFLKSRRAAEAKRRQGTKDSNRLDQAAAPLLNDGAGALTKGNWERSTGMVAKQKARNATPPEGEASPRHQQAMNDRRRSPELMLDSGKKTMQGTTDEGRLPIMRQEQHSAKLRAGADRGPRSSSSSRGGLEDDAGNRDSGGGDTDSASSEEEGKVGGRR